MRLEDVRVGMRVRVTRSAAKEHLSLRRYVGMVGVITKIYGTPFAPIRVRFEDGSFTQVYADEIEPAEVQA